MPDLPTGTLTFLFTDIERSAHLWEEDTAAMHAALARHDAILRRTIEERGGVVFKTVGDGFYSIFVSPVAALDTAVAIQRAIQREDWGEVGSLDVRIALHTGSA